MRDGTLAREMQARKKGVNDYTEVCQRVLICQAKKQDSL